MRCGVRFESEKGCGRTSRAERRWGSLAHAFLSNRSAQEGPPRTFTCYPSVAPTRSRGASRTMASPAAGAR
eukprot:4096445-Pleurochrysis_carterae.AAC.3